MINFENERLVSFTQASRVLPPGRSGKKVHVATIHRWAADKDDPLEWVVVGGMKMTSIEALQRFIQRRTARANPRARQPIRTPRQRQRAIDHATRQLEAEGC